MKPLHWKFRMGGRKPATRMFELPSPLRVLAGDALRRMQDQQLWLRSALTRKFDPYRMDELADYSGGEE